MPGMPGLERPPPIAVALRLDQLDRLSHALVGSDACAAEMLERAQDVVVPPRREGETGPRGAALAISLDHLTSRSPSEEAALEEVSCPRRRAVVISGMLPNRSSYSSRASSTQIVVLNDERIEPFAASQFQPPSDSCSVSKRSMMRRTSWPKYDADCGHLTINTGLHFTGEEGIVITLPRTATLPSHAVTDACHRAACFVARGIEANFAQQHQDVHCRVPSTVPRCAAPSPVGSLEGEQLRADALGGDSSLLGRDLLRRCIGQIPHHLPADRRVRIKQPFYHRSLWHEDLTFEWIVARSIFVSAFIIHPGLFRRYRPRTSSGTELSTIAPIIVMLPIHFHPDGPNGRSPTPYPSDVTAVRMKKAREVTVNAAAPRGIQQT